MKTMKLSVKQRESIAFLLMIAGLMISFMRGGNDMLMIQDIASGIQRVRGAVEDGRVSMESLDQSVLRVLKWKHKLGLL